MSGAQGGKEQATHDGGDALTVRLSGFTREALEQECARLNVPVDELVAFAVQYYLADADSGRLARRISGVPYPEDPL